MSHDSAWKEGFDNLPPERQAAVQVWLGTQMFIARELGLSSEKWFEYVEWAFRHRFDFSFIEGRDPKSDLQNDRVETDSDAKKRSSLVGSDSKSIRPAGPGKSNIVGMVVKGKRDRDN